MIEPFLAKCRNPVRDSGRAPALPSLNRKDLDAVVIADLKVHRLLAQTLADPHDGALGLLQERPFAGDRYLDPPVVVALAVALVDPISVDFTFLRDAAEKVE